MGKSYLVQMTLLFELKEFLSIPPYSQWKNTNYSKYAWGERQFSLKDFVFKTQLIKKLEEFF